MAPNPSIEPCPHCGSNADVTASADVRYKCQVCGKPRIPLDARLGHGGRESSVALKEAQRARVARVAWQLLSVGVGGFAAFMVLVSLGASALFDFGWLGNSMALVLSLVPALISVFAFSAAKKAKGRSQLKLDEAWQLAAARIVQRLGPEATAERLAQALGVDVEYATELLAEAEVHRLLASEEDVARVRVRIQDQAGLEAAALTEAEQAIGDLPTQAMQARKE
jgi:hypothetical protein